MKLIMACLPSWILEEPVMQKTTNSLRSLNRLRRGHHNHTGE